MILHWKESDWEKKQFWKLRTIEVSQNRKRRSFEFIEEGRTSQKSIRSSITNWARTKRQLLWICRWCPSVTFDPTLFPSQNTTKIDLQNFIILKKISHKCTLTRANKEWRVHGKTILVALCEDNSCRDSFRITCWVQINGEWKYNIDHPHPPQNRFQWNILAKCLITC